MSAVLTLNLQRKWKLSSINQKRIWMRDFSFLRTWKSSLKAMLRSRSYKWETFILTPPNSNKACFAEHGTPVCRPITCCTVTKSQSGLYQSHTTPTFLEIKCLPKTPSWSKILSEVFPTDRRNSFVLPLLWKFPYFFSLTSIWRYFFHSNSFITTTSGPIVRNHT